MNEVWKDIPGYEGYYQVSSFGSIKSSRTGKLMAFSICKGYYRLGLYINAAHKSMFVQRIVALTFIPNPESKKEVNHKNGNKLDNGVSNLEWVTPSENVRHAVRTGLRKMPSGSNVYCAVKVIDTQSGKEYGTIKDAAIALNLCPKYLARMLSGDRRNKTTIKKAYQCA